MKATLLRFGALALFSVLALTGCSNSGLGNSSDLAQISQTQAYLDGYNGNIGVSPATLSNYGGPENYSNGVVELHPDYSPVEKSDYIQGCLDMVNGVSSSASDSQGQAAGDTLNRLNSVGGDSWNEDEVNLLNGPTGYETDYLASGACTLWVFDSGENAANAANAGFLDNFTTYVYSWGTDSSGKGVIAMYEDGSSNCAADMLENFG